MDRILLTEFTIYIKRFFLICAIYLMIYSIGELNASHYLFFILNLSYIIYSYILLYPFISALIFYFENRKIRKNTLKISLELLVIYVVVIFSFLSLLNFQKSLVHNTLAYVSDLAWYTSFLFFFIYLVIIKDKQGFAFHYLQTRSFYLQWIN